MSKILEEVKDALGLIVDDDSFDGELKMHVNSALSIVYQNGIGVPHTLTDGDDWDSVIEEGLIQNEYMMSNIKQYVFLKTKILFDPPPPSSVEYVNGAADEMLWRLRENYDVLKEVQNGS